MGTRGFPSHDYSWFGFVGNLFSKKLFQVSYEQFQCQWTSIAATNGLLRELLINETQMEIKLSDASCYRKIKIW